MFCLFSVLIANAGVTFSLTDLDDWQPATPLLPFLQIWSHLRSAPLRQKADGRWLGTSPGSLCLVLSLLFSCRLRLPKTRETTAYGVICMSISLNKVTVVMPKDSFFCNIDQNFKELGQQIRLSMARDTEVRVMPTPQDFCSGPSALNKWGRGCFIKHMISARLVCSVYRQSTLAALHCCNVFTITQLHFPEILRSKNTAQAKLSRFYNLLWYVV